MAAWLLFAELVESDIRRERDRFAIASAEALANFPPLQLVRGGQ